MRGVDSWTGRRGGNGKARELIRLVRRIRNKAKLKPFDLVDPRNTELRSFLQKAEYSFTMSGDVVEADDDEGPTGSASDSD